MNNSARVVCHIDMDCFYVQVEIGLNPNLKGRPVAVSQYNPFGDLKTVRPMDNRIQISNGSLIAVSYEARASGVKRNMRGNDAKAVCPDLLLVQVPTNHGKADLTIYREAGAKVVQVLSKVIKSAVIEKASIDEVYLDVTEEATLRRNRDASDPNRFAAALLLARQSVLAGEDKQEMMMSKSSLSRGHAGTSGCGVMETDSVQGNESADLRSWFDKPHFMWDEEDLLLMYGAVILGELRAEVTRRLGYTCSGGVAQNKMLAKIASAMHKPNRQTLVPATAVESLMVQLPISRVAGFGGKLGESLSSFGGESGVKTFGDLLKVPRSELVAAFGAESTDWMLAAAKGQSVDVVQQRALTASIGCGKSFRQQNTLTSGALQDGRVQHWLRELAEELEERVAADRWEAVGMWWRVGC